MAADTAGTGSLSGNAGTIYANCAGTTAGRGRGGLRAAALRTSIAPPFATAAKRRPVGTTPAGQFCGDKRAPSGLDTGDIAGQRTLALPDGISGGEADARYGAVGGDLLAQVLGQLADRSVERHPQPVGGSYQPSPVQDEVVLDRGWTARRAFNFMRGTAEWGMPYRLQADGVLIVRPV